MDQQLVWGLLGLALLAPIIGAVVLRLLSSTLSPLVLTVSSLAIAGVAIVSVLWLGSSNVNQLQIGNLSLLLPVSRSEGLGFELPALPALVPTTPPIGAQAPTLLPLPTATVPAPTATPTLTATLTATPTATPIITATPSLTATLVSTITGSLAVTATTNLTTTDTLTPTDPITDSVPEATPQPEPTAEPTVEPTPTPSQRTYTVQAGDTLFRIAAQFNVSVEDLIRANNLSAAQADNLTVGQELIIP